MAPINIIDESDDAEDCDAQEEKDDMTWCNHFCATGRPAVHRIAARCPLPVRFSSMLLYVVVVHVARLYVVVIVYEYRLSSHLSKACARGTRRRLCLAQHAHDMRRPHCVDLGCIFRTANSSRSDWGLCDENVDRLGVLDMPLYALVAHQHSHITLHGCTG